jgi:hypothetical protein
LDFAPIIFLKIKVIHQPCIQPPTWRARSLYICPPVTEWPTCIPRHPFHRFLQLTGLQWSYSNLPPHGRMLCSIW